MIEAAAALMEAYRRRCMFDSAAVLLARIAGSGTGYRTLSLFTGGARRLVERDFGEAAGIFDEGASAAIGAGDVLKSPFALAFLELITAIQSPP